MEGAMDVTELHRRTVAEFTSRLGEVGERWDASTPCSDWNVRDLVNHVVGEDLWTVPLMGGQTVDDVGDRFDGDVLGDDPVVTGRTAAQAAIDATAEAVAAGRTVHLSFGHFPAAEYAYQLAADHLIHAWDLAAGIRADRRLDPELVDAVAEWFTRWEDAFRQAGAIGEPPPGDPPSDPQGRLLYAMGRNPDWGHPGG
jgi:uncharacterized protein (TIGR03086 family)